jgi:hypothetical protein
LMLAPAAFAPWLAHERENTTRCTGRSLPW